MLDKIIQLKSSKVAWWHSMVKMAHTGLLTTAWPIAFQAWSILSQHFPGLACFRLAKIQDNLAQPVQLVE